MLSLHTNVATLAAQNSLSKTQSSLSTSMTRLSTGFRINSAMDDAAGLQIATRLKAQTSGMAVDMRNTQNSTSMLQTAEGALDEVSNMLVRMKDLATQSADASSNTDDKKAMQSEYDNLGKEIQNIMSNTKFGGQALLQGGTLSKKITFQIGADSSETMSTSFSGELSAVNTAIGNATGSLFKGDGSTANASTGTKLATAAVAGPPTAPSGASSAITSLSTAIDAVSTLRSKIGATANRLDHVYNNLANISSNTQAAAGRVMDVDFATESSSMTSNQMLLQVGTAMLKQSNSMSSMVMSLLQ